MELLFPISRRRIKNFFNKIFTIFTKETKSSLKNRKLNGIIFPIPRSRIKRLIFIHQFYWGVKFQFYKQEMELFLLFPDLWSKNLFYKKLLTFTMESKTGVEKRKRNYPNRKWNYFSYFLTTDLTTSFTICF